jgi:YfiH family protein
MDDATIPGWRRLDGLVHGFGRRPERAETREETRARMTDALRPHGELQLLAQVHGTTLVVAPCAGTPAADASAADVSGILLGIETADCLPALFVDPRNRRVAAAHAGWRGTAAGIVDRVVRWLSEHGSRPEDLRVALGPSIGACCYEVGEELIPQFAEADRGGFTPGPRGRPHLDVRGINVRQLEAAGVPRENIESVDECTHCRPELYCSYRREGRTGRMISYVGWTKG